MRDGYLEIKRMSLQVCQMSLSDSAFREVINEHTLIRGIRKKFWGIWRLLS